MLSVKTRAEATMLTWVREGGGEASERIRGGQEDRRHARARKQVALTSAVDTARARVSSRCHAAE